MGGAEDSTVRGGSREARARRVAVALSVLAFVLVVLGRVLGPSDLGQNTDQSITMSLTADVALNGRWVLPVDMRGEVTRKPPLVNWLGAPLAALGLWGELAFKLPSLVAAAVTFVATAWIGRRLLAPIAGENAGALGWCAAAAWAGSPTGVKHAYFLRPDMVLIACVTVGWAAGVVSLMRSRGGERRGRANAVFWVAVGLAALAKGPFVLLLPAAMPLTAWLWWGSARPAWGMGWRWGVPLAAGMFCVWLVPAVASDWAYVRGTLVGTEIVERIDETPPGVLGRVVIGAQTLGYFFERFIPFALPAAIALVVWRVREMRERGMTAPAVWLALVLVVIALMGLRGGSYSAPALPAAAILGVGIVYWWWGTGDGARGLLVIASLALVSAVGVGVREIYFSRGAQTGTGEAIKAFAREARVVVGDAPVVFVGLEFSAVSSLMGRHQAGDADGAQVASARYVVMPLAGGEPLVEARSRDAGWPGLGLYAAGAR